MPLDPRYFGLDKIMLDALIAETAGHVVDFCRRQARGIVALAVLLTVAAAVYTAGHLGMNTDLDKLFDQSLDWQQREDALTLAFPQNSDRVAIVIDGATPDLAEDAAVVLAKRLAGRPDLFRSVRRPDADPFFRRNGLLFLSLEELAQTVNPIIEAEPLLGALAADPSARGLFSALSLFLDGIARGAADLERLERPLTLIGETVAGVVAGKTRPLSWSVLMSDQPPRREELRRFVVVQPVLNYGALEAAGKALDEVRAAIRDLGLKGDLTSDAGVRARLTGDVVISDEELATITENAWLSTVLSFFLVCLLLFLALRSWRLIVPVVLTLVVGLVLTTGFAAVTVGTLNPISVAFAVMFIGVGVDFSIQVGTRDRQERFLTGDPDQALRRTAAGITKPLLLAAVTTAAGFLSFLPTDYVGVSQLGLIAGAGMIIAFALNLTLFPALITLFHPPGEPASVGFVRLRPLDDWLVAKRRPVIAAGLVLGLIGMAALPWLRFDFNPLNLRDPKAESIATAFDLMADPGTTPFTIDILAADIPAAATLGERLEKLPEVYRVISISDLVPGQQAEKLAILSDATLLLAPVLAPLKVAPPPTLAATRAALVKVAAALRAAAPDPAKPGAVAALTLASRLDRVAAGDEAQIQALDVALVSGLSARLEALRLAFDAGPVSLATMPDSIRRDWVTADGRARVEVAPRASGADNPAMAQFVAAIRAIAPDATGTPVSIQESALTIVNAFLQAAAGAVFSITLILALTLGRGRDVALVLAPLALAALMTVITCVLFGPALNYANIIALPLLLGIGVAFNIYYVVNWRAGLANPLASATTRAILFSALTTVVAFGSLAVSTHPGTASLGILLTVALINTLISTFLFLPALLGPVQNARTGEKCGNW
ncbi:Hopanoid transporter HpnN [uncultured Gammaproteobacteria bacterium]